MKGGWGGIALSAVDLGVERIAGRPPRPILLDVAPLRSLSTTLAAFIGGAALALVTSGSLVEERLSRGSGGVAMIANAFVTLAAVALVSFVRERTPSAQVLVPQAVGAAVGVAAVHLVLRAELLPTPSWLSERPAQLMNDAVAVFSVLLVAWACARRLDLRLLVGALLAVTAYRMTGRHWHLDDAPLGFRFRVQDLVCAQLAATAFALALYREMTRRAS